ncbi:MAG: hypothetical protein ACK4Z6_08180, partial [Candidatus Methylomirabilales bacterium]
REKLRKRLQEGRLDERMVELEVKDRVFPMIEVFGGTGMEEMDLNLREIMTLIPITIFYFWIGLYPIPFLSRMEASVKQVLIQVHQPKAAVLGVRGQNIQDRTSALQIASLNPGGGR